MDTAKQLRRWQSDVCAFAEEACYIRDPSGNVGPVTLFDYERAFLTEADRRDSDGNLLHHYSIACWGKRDGKGTCVSLLLAHRLFLFAETHSYILANSERQAASILLENVKQLAQRSPTLAAMGPVIETGNVSVPILDSVIETLPNNASTCQGLAIAPNSFFASDEIHAAQGANPDEAFNYLCAQCEADNAAVLISSQAGPPLESNPVYRLHKLRNEPEIFFSYRTTPGTPWSKRQAELDRKTLPPPIWEILWGNAWGSRGAKLFSVAQIDACLANYGLPQNAAMWQELKAMYRINRVGGALDRALGWARQGSGDNSVWTTVGRTADDHYFVLQSDLLPTGAEGECLVAARRSRELFGVRRPILEQYQAGDLAGRIPGADLRPLTTQAKVGLYNGLYEIVADGRLHFSADCEQLRTELLSMTVDTSSPQPRFQGKPHDDHCDSLVWAIEASTAAPTEGASLGVSGIPYLAQY